MGREIDEQTQLGEVYLQSLVATQLRLGLAVAALVLIPLVSLPLLFTWWTDAGRFALGPLALPWWLLGVAIYPTLVCAAWWYARASARNERDFTELVRRGTRR